MPPAADILDIQELRLSICDAADFREAAELVLSAALQLPDIDAVGIYAFDAAGDLHLVASAGVGPAFTAQFSHFAANSPQVAEVMKGAPVYRVCKELPPERARLYLDEGLQAIAAYPVKIKECVVGALNLATRRLQEIPAGLTAQIEVFVAQLGNAIARIAYEAMLHRAYKEVEVKVRDRTLELERANEALREREERLHVALLAAEMGTWRWDAATNTDSRGPGVNRIMGLEAVPSTQPLDDFYTRVHPDDRGPVRAEFERAIRERGMYRAEFRIVRPDGTLRWVRGRGKPLYNEQGAVTSVIGAIVDITDRKRAEEALRQNEERFRLLFEDAVDGLLLADVETTRFHMANRAICQMLGYSADELKALSLSDVHPAEAMPAVMEHFTQISCGEVMPAREVPVRRKDGSVFFADVSARPVIVEGRKYLLGIFRDITARKRVEEALAEAARRKDEFLAMLGHELRNPLAPIRNAVFLLLNNGPADPSARHASEMIDRQVTHLTRLVDDLLDVSRITRGKIRLKLERVDLVEILRGASGDCQDSAEKSALCFDVRLPATPLWVRGDATRLQQIADNLLTNAVKFTDAGGTVTLSLCQDGPDWAEFVVADTGIGIEPVMLPHLFETFAQAERSLARSRGGLGLGLALVKNLTEMHGGQVLVESRGLGHGALFRVRLPLDKEVAAESRRPPASARIKRAQRILIIEDNPDAADSLALLLGLLGHECAVALTGTDGLRRAGEFHPTVVLCDIGLPGELDGYAVARALRADPEFKSLRLIAMTGYGQDEDRQRALAAGFDQHLTKPADPQVLKRLLAE